MRVHFGPVGVGFSDIERKNSKINYQSESAILWIFILSFRLTNSLRFLKDIQTKLDDHKLIFNEHIQRKNNKNKWISLMRYSKEKQQKEYYYY